jgi:CDGSH-type Zn-finger protein
MPGPGKKDEARIQVTKDGPYLVSGDIPLVKQVLVCDRKGNSTGWKEGEQVPAPESYALCRCGGSKNMPFCDGTHLKNHFNGTETASRVPYLERAEWTEGRDLRLSDAPGFCSHARFCVRGRGIWDLIGSGGEGAGRTALDMAANCHSGRLVAWDRKTGKPVEPDLEKSIGLVEGPQEGIRGPLWVRGGIPVIAADGFAYEVRNRVTLCRCGRSRNKPFCDGSHMPEAGGGKA